MDCSRGCSPPEYACFLLPVQQIVLTGDTAVNEVVYVWEEGVGPV